MFACFRFSSAKRWIFMCNEIILTVEIETWVFPKSVSGFSDCPEKSTPKILDNRSGHIEIESL